MYKRQALGDLRVDKEFTDVTLACEDGQQVEAHKVILAASSPVFGDILRRNKHIHPLYVMSFLPDLQNFVGVTRNENFLGVINQ